MTVVDIDIVLVFTLLLAVEIVGMAARAGEDVGIMGRIDIGAPLKMSIVVVGQVRIVAVLVGLTTHELFY